MNKSLITSFPRRRESRKFNQRLDSRFRGNDVLGAVLFLALLPALALPAWAAAPKPHVIIEKPGQCVADTQRMRREHPEMLKHQRDKTMHEGIRTNQFSLNGCVECHASSKTRSVLGEQGFCQSCHDYAGIKLDCFECHASKPKLAAGAKP